LGKEGDEYMSRLVKGIFLIMFLVITFTMVFTTTVKAATFGEMQQKANSFISAGKEKSGDIAYSEVTKEFVGLGQILTTVGAAVMVAVVTFMGIKYLTAGPEAQAKLKVQLIGVIVAGVVIFGAYTIWSIVVNIAETF